VKKLAIVLAVTLVLVLLFIRPISGFAANAGLRHADKPWAPTLVFGAGVARMRAFQYSAARETLQVAIQAFPDYAKIDRAYYRVALCFEKERNTQQAQQSYELFIARYPNHMWTSQARNRLERLKVL